jgi:type I restriction enzyme, S subunit
VKNIWKSCEIGQISEVTYGYTAKAESEKVGPRFLRITDIKDNQTVDWNTVPYCQIAEKDHLKHSLKNGDIVFARTGATTGKSHLVKNPPDSVCASYLIKLSLKNQTVLPEYLIRFFQTKQYWETINDGIAGSAQGGFNATKLSSLVVPFPPLPEQKRIVSILDEAFEGIDQAIANTEKNLVNARDLFESYLNNVFMQKGEGWKEEPLEKITQKITKGSSPNWQGIKYVDEPGILFVTSENVLENRMSYHNTKYVENKFNDKDSKSILKRGDVLTNIVGASIGRTAVFDRDDDANINQAVCLIRCDNSQLRNDYLAYLLNSPYFKKILHDNEIDNARANLSLGFFRFLKVPVPEIEEQGRIAKSFDHASDKTKQLESVYQQKLNSLKELKQSILQKAFTGELTKDSIH